MNKSEKVYLLSEWSKSKARKFNEFCPKHSFVSEELYNHFTSAFGEEIYFYGAGMKIQLCPIAHDINEVKKHHTFSKNNVPLIYTYLGLLSIEEAKQYVH